MGASDVQDASPLPQHSSTPHPTPHTSTPTHSRKPRLPCRRYRPCAGPPAVPPPQLTQPPTAPQNTTPHPTSPQHARAPHSLVVGASDVQDALGAVDVRPLLLQQRNSEGQQCATGQQMERKGRGEEALERCRCPPPSPAAVCSVTDREEGGGCAAARENVIRAAGMTDK